MKRILITGCSTGIGYASAIALKQAGWRVLATCRQSSDVEKLTQLGFEAYVLDVTNSQQIHAIFNHVYLHGGLDALFCNAGYGQVGAVEDISRPALCEQFETNVFGVWECVTCAMKIFRQQGYGKIIVNSSILGFAGMPYRGAYNSSKFALEGMCDTLRTELHGSQIYVSLLQPGPITTNFKSNALIKFYQYIDSENSVHQQAYTQQIERLNTQRETNIFTLPATSCAKAVLQCLNAKKPKARYQVTFPTKLFWWLRRLLPTWGFDWLNRRAGG